MTNENEINEIVKKLQESKKYKDVYEPVLKAVTIDCLSRYGKKFAFDKAKNVLHQTWGAFWETRPDFSKLQKRFEEDVKNGKSIKEAIIPILSLQSSTKERVPVLNDFYTKIFEITGFPKSIIEHASGLNPLTIFWMDLPKETKYTAYDIDITQQNFLSSVFSFLNMAEKAGIKLGDVLNETFGYADVVFLFKAIPCLERQENISIPDLLRKQKCKFLVTSFPTKSIGGKEKGMKDYYTNQFSDILKSENLEHQIITFPTELVFVVKMPSV